MELGLDWTVIGMLLSSMVLIFFLGQLLMRPLKLILKIAGIALLTGAGIAAFSLFI